MISLMYICRINILGYYNYEAATINSPSPDPHLLKVQNYFIIYHYLM